MSYLTSVIKQFEYYKLLGEQTFAQVPEEKLFWQYNEDSNSIAMIVKHLWGNMLSRWTDFLDSDGEKEWRDRDAEFDNDIRTKEELMQKWHAGWKVFMDTLRSLQETDLERTIYIRNQGHSVMEAINRQLAHYPYHIGQIVFIGKMAAGSWQSLSIPKGGSQQFNASKFAQAKRMAHFTDEFLNQTVPVSVAMERVHAAHERLWEVAAGIPAEKRNEAAPGKWSVLQHVQHITKGAGAYYQYLKMDGATIQQRFGLAGRPSLSPDQVKAMYEKALAAGGKSTAAFEPVSAEDISLEEEQSKGRHIISGMAHQLERWQEEDLDRYVCPHPLLGAMTAREMLYFTAMHAEHHTRSVLRIIQHV